MKGIVIVCALALLFGCIAEEHEPVREEEEFQFPVFVDINDLPYPASLVYVDDVGVAIYQPFHFGVLTDTFKYDADVIVKLFAPPEPPPPPDMVGSYKSSERSLDPVQQERYDEALANLLPHMQEYGMDKGYHVPNEGDIELYVDVTQKLKVLDFTSKEIVKLSYPVVLCNTSNDTIIAGYGTSLQVVMEAKDPQGDWVPIEKHRRYGCGNGLMIYTIFPGEQLLTAAPIFSGSFETQLRLKMGDNYSEPFNGSIDPGQFVDRGR